MSGGGESLGGGGKTKRGSSKRKTKKRVGFRIDMTPLVDITFLLLTFFMFTTTMAAPQVMEMSVPPETEEVEVAESQLLQFYVRDDGAVFFAMGKDEPERIDPKKLTQISDISARENLKEEHFNKLIVALYSSGDAPYGLVVTVLDQLNVAEGIIVDKMKKDIDPETGKPVERQRRFTIAPLLPEDVERLKGL
jgi:biopolymer transport protein ExbD